jgi:hypothetical protein
VKKDNGVGSFKMEMKGIRQLGKNREILEGDA